jgi:hypothetical protein
VINVIMLPNFVSGLKEPRSTEIERSSCEPVCAPKRVRRVTDPILPHFIGPHRVFEDMIVTRSMCMK